MLKNDNLLAGMALALIFPVTAFAVAYLLKDNFYILNRPALPYLVAIALNLISMRLFARKKMVKTIRGIIIITFAFMLAMFFLKLHIHA